MRLLEVDLDAEALLQPAHDDLHVDLREPADDLLAGLLVPMQVDRRVLLLQLAEAVGDLVLVALGLRLDRKRHHGRGRVERRDRDVSGL